MFSIGEFARLGTVSVRTLRHYDEIGLLRPARVDPETGYRGYTADQLGQLNRILALKELGLSLAQARRLITGITVAELRGMLVLRHAQLEQELAAHRNQLLTVEARLRFIEKEGTMPADDITLKKVPAMGIVTLTAPAPGWGAPNIVPVVNWLVEQFDQLGIPALITQTGPRIVFYNDNDGSDVRVFLAQPVAEPPDELPATATYQVLPEVEVAATVRNGPAAGIFPMVYHDLIQWAEAQGFQTSPPGREVWINEVADIADVDQQVFEIQLPVIRPGSS